MKHIPFDQIHSTSSAIIDLGSALELFRDSVEFVAGDGALGALRSKVSSMPVAEKRDFLHACWSSRVLKIANRHEAALRTLEQAVVHDCLVIDRVLVDPNVEVSGMPKHEDAIKAYAALFSHPFFALTDVPEAVRQAAVKLIQKKRRVFIDLDYKPGIPESFYGPDKTAHDAMSSSSEVYAQHCFANSEDCAERAWFYLCVSDAAKAPLVVSSAKMNYLSHVRRTMHQVLSTRLIKDQDQKAADEFLDLGDIDVALPPIQEMLLLKSLYEDISPLEACIAIREMPEAVAYRAEVRRLYTGLQGPANARAEAKKRIGELETLAAKWRIDPNEEIKYRSYKLRLGKVPKIGEPAEVVSPEIEWSLPKWLGAMLNSPNPVHVFISSWFRGSER